MSLSVSIHHQLGGFALDVAFEAPSGVTSLFGRSGAGKTSVINAVAGLLRPDQARITLKGEVLTDTAAGISLPPHKRRIGYVFQEARLFPHLDVRRNLTYGARMNGVAEDAAEFSRVALDDARKAEILPYLERIRDEAGVPMLHVSHSAAEAGRLASNVVVLEAGQVLRAGSAAEVLGDPSLAPTGVREVGAVLRARVVTHHDDGLSEVDAGGVQLMLPQIAQPVGTELRIRIAAHDVILSLNAPEQLSALNALHGRIEAIHAGDGPGAIVALATPAGTLLARLTKRSVARLDLSPGKDCYAILKTVAIAPENVGVAAR
ncbi:MAG: ATP-binding cassette domain-containing protein [Maritimibacter sp.]